MQYLWGNYFLVSICDTEIMDIHTIRRENLRALIDSRCNGVDAECARIIDRQASYVSRLLYLPEKAGAKKMGETIARHIEASFGLPTNAMDKIGAIAKLDAGKTYELNDIAGLYAIEGWDSSTPLNDEDVEIPLYKEVEMAAGDGTSHSVEINGRKLRFALSTLRAAGVDPSSAACATVTGNSMERLILDGATIGIDRSRTQIKDGKIYAIDHCGMLRVKSLYRAPGGGLRLHSENSNEHPDEIYSPEQAASDIKILGWVFWWSQIATW
jgi:phage repressor protein C with HTH and peptisase S24 domain